MIFFFTNARKHGLCDLMADCGIGFQKRCKSRSRRMVLVMGIMVFNVFVFQILGFLSRGALSPHFGEVEILDLEKSSSLYGGSSSSTSVSIGKFSLLNGLQNSGNSSVVFKGPKKFEALNMGNKFDDDNKERDEKLEGGDHAGDDIDRGNSLQKRASVGKIVEFDHGAFNDLGKLNLALPLEQFKKPDEESPSDRRESVHLASDIKNQSAGRSHYDSSDTIVNAASGSSFSGQSQTFQETPMLNGATSGENFTGFRILSINRKKNMGFPVGYPIGLPPVYISEMNRLLVMNRNAYHSMRPRWPSSLDQQLFAIRAQIESAPIIKNIQELYAPAFRNISVFKRSYELMVRTLKVYVYKEGQKPIFHQPLLNGIYSSEGWFMKLMEGNRNFIVKDPRKAHLFYLPFSSRLLQSTLYVPNSHNRTLMELCLKEYLDKIATKYPFWNRTGGADHFLVACHDWAPYETASSLVLAIRALCTADVHSGFVLGKDVSLPQIYIWSAGQYHLRGIGGRPANKRHILAFFAGKLHGRLRPILLQHWENKDPDMKIFGPMSSINMNKMDYIQHMKNSKYCLCPSGHEGNSPRIVESIFYECVPVLISDNYVPPFFEVLNWDAFAVILPEKDVPRLKSILVSIHEKKYLKLQLGVRKVQKHFLWHTKPVKYDLFHMTLHSIWYNRLYQIRT
ncbi:uncharacterized protein LOC120259018 isoform X3 [Dioscorea cayenensis subsp. rotundata]|uniref:Uncharacterized protein LOC120259018 isoform X3 n=1 Tax=Dioscorea cayennensis subsp. rotundata TaxID=55577 RepID=A0AB40B6U7_DIOCR|nr:uncharacterized protein LOC120259018 isoform X3 [Dioscorea cayenensis subsp. rotundata]